MPNEPNLETTEVQVDPATEETVEEIVDEQEDQTECLTELKHQNSTLLHQQTELKTTLDNMRIEQQNQTTRLNQLTELVQSTRSQSVEHQEAEPETTVPEINPADADARPVQRTNPPEAEPKRKRRIHVI